MSARAPQRSSARAAAPGVSRGIGAPEAARSPEGAAERVRTVVRAVVERALRDAGRARIALLRAQSPEARLLRDWLGDLAEITAQAEAPDVLQLDPLNKTALLLAPDRAAAPVLPLGDLYAGRLALLAGDWSAPDPLPEWIEHAGGLGAVDAFLEAVVEGRSAPARAAHMLGEAGRTRIVDAYTGGWWWRRRIGVVPKLETRTAGLDPF